MNSRQYPQFLTANPMVFGISIKFLMAMAALTGMGSLLQGMNLIDVRPDLVLMLAFSSCLFVALIQKKTQRNFMFFYLRKKKILSWFFESKSRKKKKTLGFYLYELELEDLEQKEVAYGEDLVTRMKNNLNTLKTDMFYKVYHLENRWPSKTFLLTNDESFYLFGMKARPISLEGDETNEANQVLCDIFGGPSITMPFLSNIVVNEDMLKINDKYWRFINIYKMADTELLKFQNYGHDYLVFFRKVEGEKAKFNAKHKRRFHYSNINSSIRDIESEASYSQNEELLEDLIHGRQSLFDAEIWFILKEDSIERIKERTLELCKKLNNDGFQPFVENVALTQIMQSMALDKRPLFKRSHLLTSDILINSLPLTSDYLMNKGIDFISRSYKRIHFDLFDKGIDSYCAVITGPQGSGKSMLGNKILKEELAHGSKAIILDLGYSFKKTVQYYGGVQFDLKFNPMAFKNPQYLKEVIKSVIPDRELTEKNEGLILKAIKNILLEDENNQLNFKTLVEKIEKETKIEISPYFEELFDFFSDEPILDLEPLIYVDTSIYPKKIQAPLILFLIEYFRNMDGRRIFLFDECWDLLKKHAQFIAECFRTFRKQNASAIAITQLIDDFSKYPFGQDILDLTYHKFIYHQFIRNEAFDSFDKERVQEIRTVKGEYSEVYYKSFKHRKIFRYYASPLEYELFTSDFKDNEMINKFMEQSLPLFGFKESMDKWVRLKYA